MTRVLMILPLLLVLMGGSGWAQCTDENPCPEMARLQIIGGGVPAAAPPAGNDFASDANCQAVWLFEDGALTTDGSGEGNTLTNGNTVTTNTTTYKQGAASAEFTRTSSQYFTRTDADLSASFPYKSGTTPAAISVTAWVRGKSDPGATAAIWAKYVASSNDRTIILLVAWSVTGNPVTLWTGYTSGTLYEQTQTDCLIAIDTWYHIGFTYEVSSQNWYVKVWNDTAQTACEDSGTLTNAISVTDAPFEIGRYSTTNYWDGMIDELAVFNDVLTEVQIDAIRGGTYAP